MNVDSPRGQVFAGPRHCFADPPRRTSFKAKGVLCKDEPLKAGWIKF